MFNSPAIEIKVVENTCVTCQHPVTTTAQHCGPVVCMRCGQIFYVGFRRAA